MPGTKGKALTPAKEAPRKPLTPREFAEKEVVEGTAALEALVTRHEGDYKPNQGKLPASRYDSICGLGGAVLSGKETQAWVGYVEEIMQAGDCVQSGMLA